MHTSVFVMVAAKAGVPLDLVLHLACRCHEIYLPKWKMPAGSDPTGIVASSLYALSYLHWHNACQHAIVPAQKRTNTGLNDVEPVDMAPESWCSSPSLAEYLLVNCATRMECELHADRGTPP
jgi:hypothetical protein